MTACKVLVQLHILKVLLDVIHIFHNMLKDTEFCMLAHLMSVFYSTVHEAALYFSNSFCSHTPYSILVDDQIFHFRFPLLFISYLIHQSCDDSLDLSVL